MLFMLCARAKASSEDLAKICRSLKHRAVISCQLPFWQQERFSSWEQYHKQQLVSESWQLPEQRQRRAISVN